MVLQAWAQGELHVIYSRHICDRNWTVRVFQNPELRDLIVYRRLRSAQSGICFSSAWNKYVRQFGMDVRVTFSCFGDTPLMLKFRLSRARTGSITFRQSQCVENPSYLTAPNPVCRPWPYRLPYRLL